MPISPGLTNRRWLVLAATLATLVVAPACSGAPAARPAAPHSATLPAIVGVPTAGRAVRARVGRWSGRTPIRLAIAWERCDPGSKECERIPGATRRTFLPTLIDVGFSLSVTVRATNRAGRVTAASRQSAAVVAPQGSRLLFSDTFDGHDGLVTNEYAYFHPDDAAAARSLRWEMTSGSLFRQGETAWSGYPNRGAPDPYSVSANDSAIFRLHTRREDFGDVAVQFHLRNDGVHATDSTPAVAWDGVHVFLRYQSQYHLYYASINRRDDTAVIKKKCIGGPSNGGTYYTLGDDVAHAVPYGRWQDVRATVENEADGAVTMTLTADGKQLLEARDTGIGCPPITSPGAVGIRGDNAEFHVEDFVVEALP